MKTILTLLLVLFLAVLLYNRQRIYLRDPLATVYRNNVQQTGVQVFINYSSDVLLQQDADPAPLSILIQQWNRKPGTPTTLTCLRWIACMTDSDQASAIPLAWTGKGKYDPKVLMTTREVSFIDTDASAVRIELR
ncbi:MAG: hypothetical protein ABSG84_11295 [Acidobacteriaceae bacterium]|jgi:hypothetical protein